MKVPKGTSDYQATWIVDEDDEENGEFDEESSDDDDDNDDMLDEAMDGDDEENNSQVHTESISGHFKHLSPPTLSPDYPSNKHQQQCCLWWTNTDCKNTNDQIQSVNVRTKISTDVYCKLSSK